MASQRLTPGEMVHQPLIDIPKSWRKAKEPASTKAAGSARLSDPIQPTNSRPIGDRRRPLFGRRRI